MTNKYEKIVHASYENGKLNRYMRDRLLRIDSRGITDDLINEIEQDAEDASYAGVNSDRDYNIYFFIVRFADDMLKDTFGMSVDPDRKKDLYSYVLSHNNDENYSFDNLVDYMILIHKWLCNNMSKRAYPNTVGKDNREPLYSLDKWIDTLKSIYSALHFNKVSKAEAIEYFTRDFETDERKKFINWMKYYEDGNTEKYNVKNANFIKEAFGQDISIPQSWLKPEDRASDGQPQMSTRKDKEQTKREKELEKAKVFKTKMRGRLRSFKKLLERYHDILSKQDLDHVYDELYALEKSVSKLDVYASMQDCIIRSANRLEKIGFSEGADFLHKCADESVDGDVIEAIPPTGSQVPNLPQSSVEMTNMQEVIRRLEVTSKALKSRDMIRELASIDILLNEMGLASYFPELSFAQSKLIEAFGYASNKVEDIVAKLRGSGTPSAGTIEQKMPEPPKQVIPAPPAIPTPPAPAPKKTLDTNEIMSKPMPEVKEKLPRE